MRKAVVAILCLLLTSCDPLSRSELTLFFSDDGRKVTARVSSDDRHLALYHADEIDRLAEDILGGRDEWSLRFTRAGAENDRIVIDRQKGRLRDTEQTGTFDASKLQSFFYDVGVVAEVKHLEDWVELNLYPGASNRASREQRAFVDAELSRFAGLAVAYFDSLRELYAHLDANPSRAEAMFDALVTDGESELPEMSQRERSIRDRLRAAIDALMEVTEGPHKDLPRLADLAYNPFPAAVRVQVKGEVLSLEGFAREEDGTLVASTLSPLEALVSLEGRWARPDPLAIALSGGEDEKVVAILTQSSERRVATSISDVDVRAALISAMKPAPRYHVRWRIPPPSSRDRTGSEGEVTPRAQAPATPPGV